MEINMHLSFQRINYNPTRFEMKLDEENTKKEKDDEYSVASFQTKRIEQTVYISNIIKVTC